MGGVMQEAVDHRDTVWPAFGNAGADAPAPAQYEPTPGIREASASSVHQADDEPRIQVVCRGVPATPAMRESLRQAVRELVASQREELSLVVARLERAPDHRLRGVYGCRVEMFSRGLEHVAGYGENPEPFEAISQAAARASRALDARTRFDPWTSPSPSSHPVPSSSRPVSVRPASVRPTSDPLAAMHPVSTRQPR